MSGDGKSTVDDRPPADTARQRPSSEHDARRTTDDVPSITDDARRDRAAPSTGEDRYGGSRGDAAHGHGERPPDPRDTPTALERPASGDRDDPRDAKSTAYERPPSSAPRAIGTRDPGSGDERASRRSTRRSIAPGGARYAGGDEIGRGGMGRVVEATDTLLDRRVAVKEALTTDPELLRRFARETKITARLEHPSIVPVYDAGTVDGAPFYVMRRVSGRPLSELIRNAPTLNERLALVPHLLAAAQAIAHAHQRGIIHRDIKPSNILVGELGETVVIDWGLAKVIDEPDDDERGEIEPGASSSLRTRIGAVFGTPGFMAPDQLRGEPVGPQGDVYSLGASLYNLLAASPPHYSDDSTQMMKLAAQGPPTPIAQLVPGVPAELSTIVDRATDYDVTRRYRDAGAFAEELQRFLAGQLVASHRYSRRERFVRFVRKHRVAIAAVTAAAVVVVIVGAFAVSQVIEERDRADAQARLAKQGQHEAEVARAMADDRADLLLISRAKALVETNPTAALASLKQLSKTSKHIDEARAIINAARLRGVSWAMRANDAQTAFATLDQSAERLAQITVHGKVHVYDLGARREVFSTQLARGVQVRWILDGKRLLAAGRGPTRVFDRDGAEQPTDLPDLGDVSTDERGVVLVATDANRRALRIDLETGAMTVLAERATGVAMSAAGTHCAVLTDGELLVFDRTATPLLRRGHVGVLSLVAFSNRSVAVLDGKVFEAPLERNATWTALEVTNPDPAIRPYWIAYAADRLFAAYTDATVLAATSRGGMREVGRVEVTTGGMMPFGGEYLVVGTDGRLIHYVDGARMRQLALPIALRHLRLASRRSHPRIVAIGDGAIVVVELEMLPQLLPIQHFQSTRFLTEQVLLSSNTFGFDYGWYDVASGRAVRAATEQPSALRSFDREEGRLMVIEGAAGGRRAVVFRAGHETPDDVIDAPFEEIQLIGGHAIVYSFGHKVFGGFDKTPKRPQLFTTDGNVRIIVRLAGNRFAAITANEIVRSDLKTGVVERIPLPDGPAVEYAVGHGDALVFARGNGLWRWDTTLAELATVESDINYVLPCEGGVVVTLNTHSTHFVGLDGKITRLASTRGDAYVSPRRVIVPGQLQYDVVELPSFARWSLPIVRIAGTSEERLDLSSSGTQLVEKAYDNRLWLWRLPITDDVATALDATNLSEDRSGLLLWPWQSPDPTR